MVILKYCAHSPQSRFNAQFYNSFRRNAAQIIIDQCFLKVVEYLYLRHCRENVFVINNVLFLPLQC